MSASKNNVHMYEHHMIVAAILVVAAPVVLVVGWLIWKNWHHMDALDIVFIAGLPAMFVMEFGLKWLSERPAVQSLTAHVPLKGATRSHLLQTAPFVAYLLFAAILITPEIMSWWAILRLLAAWLAMAAVVEIWVRYRPLSRL